MCMCVFRGPINSSPYSSHPPFPTRHTLRIHMKRPHSLSNPSFPRSVIAIQSDPLNMFCFFSFNLSIPPTHPSPLLYNIVCVLCIQTILLVSFLWRTLKVWLPESRGETARGNAVLVDHLVRAVQRGHCCVDLGLESFTSDRIAIAPCERNEWTLV